ILRRLPRWRARSRGASPGPSARWQWLLSINEVTGAQASSLAGVQPRRLRSSHRALCRRPLRGLLKENRKPDRGFGLDSNRGGLDSNGEVLDSNREVLDSSREVLDSNREVLDSSREVLDSKREVLDSNREVLDSSREVLDSNREVLDSNREVLDSN